MRSFLIFNIVIAALSVVRGHLVVLWVVSVFWGMSLAIRYVRLYGWPGTHGWFGEEWETWMESRQQHRPEPLTPTDERGPDWRNRDLV